MGYRDNFFKNNKSNHGWYHCDDCGKGIRKHGTDVDHIIPRHYHGSDSSWNLRATCPHCNRSKQDSLDGVVTALLRNVFR